jgi:LysR family transcriptional regulator for bpeEF and oprC
MDLFQSMKIFASVVGTGSFSRASEALQMSRPGVTKAVQMLEAEFGTRLLNRTTRRLSLTSEGEAFYEKAARILSDVSDVTSLFSGSGGEPRGRLRIELPVAFARLLIGPRLREFNRLYPGIDLVVGVSDGYSDMVAEGIDCVVRIGDLKDSALIGRRIGFVPLVMCASPDYLAEAGTPTTIDDLERHRAVIYFSGVQRKVLDWQFATQDGLVGMRPRSGILVNDSDTFVESGLGGFGILQALGVNVLRQLEEGTLVELLPEFQPPPKPVSVLYPDRRYLAPPVRAFIDWVTALFAESEGRWIKRA